MVWNRSTYSALLYDQQAMKFIIYYSADDWDSDAAFLPHRAMRYRSLRDFKDSESSTAADDVSLGPSTIVSAMIAGVAGNQMVCSATLAIRCDRRRWRRYGYRGRCGLSRCLDRFENPSEAFRWYAANRISRVAEVQRISIENSWMRGPTETDWFYCYDPCVVELVSPDKHETVSDAHAVQLEP